MQIFKGKDANILRMEEALSKQADTASQIGAFGLKLERISKKALKVFLYGCFVIGLIFLMFLNWDVVRNIGYTLVPDESIAVIRDVLFFVFRTASVYEIMTMLAGVFVFLVELCFIFSIVGFFTAYAIRLLCPTDEESVDTIVNERKEESTVAHCRYEKIFLSYSVLRN